MVKTESRLQILLEGAVKTVVSNENPGAFKSRASSSLALGTIIFFINQLSKEYRVDDKACQACAN